MANHVYSYFEITFKTEEDCNKFSEWIGLEPRDENITWPTHIEACCNTMMDNLYPEKEDTREWWIDNVGAKWMYFDDVDKSSELSVIISMTSAWDFPDKLFYKLSDFLRKQYQDVTITSTFEDEGFNFIGAAAANQQFRDIEYFHPDLEEIQDEEGYIPDEFYEEMVEKKDEILNEVLAFIQQDLNHE